ncbi:YwmB family TATA-box binding protein [Robertmurraya kyonggiensis]|uniref:TATA-box binding n=1 Tax=Robertmurraya kyonggiensis TaxID=1037680 RepID=A0A4U1D3H7_9BACI|nr:YwmB family TATA-box binding protein [Robertmurraya kyonggiensis]TKC16949.1 hypothetical protein FA727_12855 [Robertmurraya kyonggiensis]
MKRKIMAILALLAVIGTSLFFAGDRFVKAKGQEDLLTLVTVLQSENIDISGWSLHAREKIETSKLEDVQKYVQTLKTKFPDWTWQVTSTSDKWEAIATKASSQGFQENIQILSTLTMDNPQTYMIYEVQGKNFTEKTEQFIKEDLQQTFSDIFRENTTIFSCIIGEFNDKMNTNLPFTVNRILDLFEAKEMESIQEENFVATSAYSPLFADGLTTKDKEMNLQLGIRTERLGAQTTLVVGTPIITIEY